ncbi:MAG TPA: hypothetical protein VGF48_03645 [Thermoanaerobaculia bacterium]|jgi:hypothetical protein
MKMRLAVFIALLPALTVIGEGKKPVFRLPAKAVEAQPAEPAAGPKPAEQPKPAEEPKAVEEAKPVEEVGAPEESTPVEEPPPVEEPKAVEEAKPVEVVRSTEPVESPKAIVPSNTSSGPSSFRLPSDPPIVPVEKKPVASFQLPKQEAKAAVTPSENNRKQAKKGVPAFRLPKKQ